MRSLGLALGAALGLWAGALYAQTASEVQTCIFNCLYNSPGAGSAEYNSCVETICNAADSSTPQDSIQQGWSLTEIFPDTPPYLDGRVAEVTTLDGALSLSYVCGRDGDSSMLIYGDVLRSLGVLDGRGHSMRLTVDAGAVFWVGVSEYEGGLFADVGPDDPLLQALMSGSQLAIDLPRYSAQASLFGSSDTLGAALGYCAGAAATPEPAPQTSAAIALPTFEVAPSVDTPQASLGTLTEQCLDLADATGLDPNVPFATLRSQGAAAVSLCEQALESDVENQHLRYVTALANAAVGDMSAVERHLRQGADAGYAPAQNALGVALFTGRFGSPDPEAHDWIKRAADQDYAPGLVNLAGHGLGSEVLDLVKLVEGHKRAAAMGDPVAMELLGVAYYHGYGVPDDEDEALRWYRAAFDAGNFDASRGVLDLLSAKGQAGDWEQRSLEGGHREAVLMRWLYAPGDARAEGLRAITDAFSASSINMQWEGGFRYLDGHFRDSDAGLLFAVIFERRNPYSQWTPAEIEQMLAPLRERYDCADGKLFLRSHAVIGCDKS
jgi:TPR repeat protein